mmetsp:Transcript_20598/g.57154  ORF Transcript_20598/g.57154 Transcript_20598/m.57154 type:complete len:225 (-) Transcript_20598:178-852(-)
MHAPNANVDGVRCLLRESVRSGLANIDSVGRQGGYTKKVFWVIVVLFRRAFRWQRRRRRRRRRYLWFRLRKTPKSRIPLLHPSLGPPSLNEVFHGRRVRPKELASVIKVQGGRIDVVVVGENLKVPLRRPFGIVPLLRNANVRGGGHGNGPVRGPPAGSPASLVEYHHHAVVDDVALSFAIVVPVLGVLQGQGPGEFRGDHGPRDSSSDHGDLHSFGFPSKPIQ